MRPLAWEKIMNGRWFIDKTICFREKAKGLQKLHTIPIGFVCGDWIKFSISNI